MRRIAILSVCMACTAPARGGDGKTYEFPKGVPFKAAEVEWYTATDVCQDERGGWKHLSNQSWNEERPWINAGLESSPNAKTYKFVRMGKGKIEYWTENARFFTNGGHYLRWRYPAGTVFGEVIVADKETVEVFTLEFKAGKAEPTFHRYRPFGTRDEIAKYITREQRYVARFRDFHGTGRRVAQLGRFGESLMDVLATGPVIDVWGIRHEVELSDEGVKGVLNRPFKDVIDVVFSEHEGLKCYGPTTNQRQGIVPARGEAGMFDSKSCLACHRTAGVEGRLLDSHPRRDLYGNIRGSGYVFSFNPIKKRQHASTFGDE